MIKNLLAATATLFASMALTSCANSAQDQKQSTEDMKPNKKTLVVIDVQRDFYDPSGSLYVQGGELLPEKIAAIAEQYDAVIFTLDWHPGDHCSFAAQGGPWPSHCVAYTCGAGLPDCFSSVFALGSDKVKLHFKAAGKDREQYGGFEADTDQETLELLKESSQIDVCGIAGDYCVKETIANMLNFVPAKRITILTDLVCSIDDGTVLKDFIKDKQLATR